MAHEVAFQSGDAVLQLAGELAQRVPAFQRLLHHKAGLSGLLERLLHPERQVVVAAVGLHPSELDARGYFSPDFFVFRRVTAVDGYLADFFSIMEQRGVPLECVRDHVVEVVVDHRLLNVSDSRSARRSRRLSASLLFFAIRYVRQQLRRLVFFLLSSVEYCIGLVDVAQRTPRERVPKHVFEALRVPVLVE